MVTREPYHIDPEVDGLLREIAADPRSTFFKASQPRNPRSWADYTEPFSTWTPGLTAAEKHLVRVHRIEVATLLKARWAIEMIERSPRHIHFALSTKDRVPPPLVDLQVWRTAASDQARRCTDTGEASLIESLLDQARLHDRGIQQLVAQAMRLDPSNHGRILVGLEFIRRGEYRSAQFQFSQVLHADCGQTLSSFAWDGLAHAESLQGNLSRARDYYAQAVRLDGLRTTPLASLLLLSSQTGRLDLARSAAEWIDALDDWADQALERFVEAELRTRASGAWSVNSHGRLVRERLAERVGPRARKVLDALR